MVSNNNVVALKVSDPVSLMATQDDVVACAAIDNVAATFAFDGGFNALHSIGAVNAADTGRQGDDAMVSEDHISTIPAGEAV